MKYFMAIFISFLFFGCAPVQKGDYVTYTSDEYLFMDDAFINKKMDCLELGTMKEGVLDVKYCVGYNYASALVQGFIFEHNYARFQDRFIGSTLSFKTKHTFTVNCLSETINDASSGKEYLNCMIPQRKFDLFIYIRDSKEDINGVFRAAVGDRNVFTGVIDTKGKQRLIEFYKAVRTRNEKEWKNRSL